MLLILLWLIGSYKGGSTLELIVDLWVKTPRSSSSHVDDSVGRWEVVYWHGVKFVRCIRLNKGINTDPCLDRCRGSYHEEAAAALSTLFRQMWLGVLIWSHHLEEVVVNLFCTFLYLALARLPEGIWATSQREIQESKEEAEYGDNIWRHSKANCFHSERSITRGDYLTEAQERIKKSCGKIVDLALLTRVQR